jgi:hypothetical protein
MCASHCTIRLSRNLGRVRSGRITPVKRRLRNPSGWVLGIADLCLRGPQRAFGGHSVLARQSEANSRFPTDLADDTPLDGRVAHLAAWDPGPSGPVNKWNLSTGPHRVRSGSVQRILSTMLRKRSYSYLKTYRRSTADRILSIIGSVASRPTGT